MKEPIGKYKLELKNLEEASSDFKKISCPSCHHDTPGTDINIQDKVAKCNNCNSIFSIQKQVDTLITKESIKQEIIRPEGIDLFYFKDDLDISIQQPPNELDIVLVFILPFIAIITTAIYFSSKGSSISPLIPTLFWALSLYPIINLINSKKHKLHIVLDDKMLSIFRKPKKFIKDQHFDARDIDQLYVKKNQHLYTIYMTINGVNGQKEVKLISNLDSVTKARFLEQEIENHLGIEDRRMPDEVNS